MTQKEILEQNLSLLLSYLQAENGSKYNHIYATPNKSVNNNIPTRTSSIGLAQFFIQYNKYIGSTKTGKKHFRVEKATVRVEKNYFSHNLTIFAEKVKNLEKSDFIIFGDNFEFFISEKDNWGNQAWIADPNYYKKREIDFGFGLFSVYEYDIYKLLKDKKIKSLSLEPCSNKVVAFSGNFNNEKDCEREYFDYSNFVAEKDMLKHIYIQNDPRTPQSIYFCPFGCRYTNRISTIKNLAKEITKITNISEKNIYQKLQYAKRQTTKKDIAIPAIFDLDPKIEEKLLSNINFDSSCIINHKYVIFLSQIKDYDVIEHKRILKTENKTEYQAEYQAEYKKENAERLKMYSRIKMYLKRHNNEFNPKWNDEEILFASELIEKAKA